MLCGDLRDRGQHAGAEFDLAGIECHHSLVIDREEGAVLGLVEVVRLGLAPPAQHLGLRADRPQGSEVGSPGGAQA